MERISLTKSLNKSLALLLAALVLIMSAFFGYMRFLQLNGIVETAVEGVANEVQSTFGYEILKETAITEDNARAFLARRRSTTAWIMIENARNELVASTGMYLEVPEGTGHRMEVISGEELHVYSKSLVSENGLHLGRVHVVTDKSAIKEVVLKETASFVLVSVAVAGMIFLLTLLFSRKVTKRLNELKRISQQFAVRNFDEQAFTKPFDEIGQLGEVMNYMSESWQEHHRYRGEFFSQTAHNLKTPLTVMTTWIDYLKDHPDEHEEGLASIEHETEKLKHMLNILLEDVADGKEALYLSNVNLKEWMETELSKWKLAFSRNELKVHMEIVDINLDLDIYRMGQLVFNLVDNVLKYTPVGSRFEIEAYKEEKFICIAFSDNGPGISELQMEAKGHGLGLKSVKSIASLHGGTADVSESNLGGVKVMVRLPLQRR
ncbi:MULTISPECIES: HAMP domain-containing sensor histidine kinase [unclassified Fusibacter]|uniref:sensor histidine kinase n=1 Tax=unclassified Fusibacter TaxID=2624464 RepID=UPI0013E8FE76|nr:HAMP domain-containing sensor histidine kinase [Fusibacter sp. A1]MCK8060310.1 HAMP domain-containing histidine kinase [Fusibacter sp. A2]NPE20401.1 HAMP domain-containing histidine kinase [Fusibacter sp. A1]